MVDRLPELVAELLRSYPNQSVDLSWVVFDDYVALHLDAWVALLEQFPDRFLIGSDQVGHFDSLPETMKRYDVLLARLSPATARKIAHDNFLRLLPRSAPR